MEFDREYQEELLLTATKNRDLLKLIRPDVFDPDLQPIVRRLQKDKLSKGQLRQLCRTQGVSFKASGDTGCGLFDRSMVSTFTRVRSLRRGLAQAHVLLEDGEVDKAKDIILKSDVSISGSNGLTDLLAKGSKRRTRKNVIPTGISGLDAGLAGGPAAGDVATVLAKTNGGKTSFLVAVGACAVEQGYTVFHATLEVPAYEIENKYMARLCDHTKPPDKTWRKIRNKLGKSHAHLYVVEFPPNTVSMGELDNHVPSQADLILIDYGDYLRPPSGSPVGDYRDLGDTWSEMKRVGMERRIPVWTASQVNRMAYDKGMLTVHDVAGSINKCNVSDQVVSINQTDAQKRPDTKSGESVGTLFVAKNRHGEAMAEVDVTIHFGKCVFKGV